MVDCHGGSDEREHKHGQYDHEDHDDESDEIRPPPLFKVCLDSLSPGGFYAEIARVFHGGVVR